jgi:hypothetical protein
MAISGAGRRHRRDNSLQPPKSLELQIRRWLELQYSVTALHPCRTGFGALKNHPDNGQYAEVSVLCRLHTIE